VKSTNSVILVMLAVGFCTGGCHHPPCKDIPPGAIPQPIGTYVCQWQTEQMARAEADDFVIYRYEWLRETDQFSPFGGQHVMRMAKRLPLAPFPVVIEPSDNQELDQARRARLIGMLAELGTADASQRVVIGVPEAEGLYGQEAPNVTRQMFRTSGGTGGGSTFGFGGFQGGFRGALGGGFSAF